jgi:glycosyltransferase involved in cell wall biosynthesis
MRIGINLLYLIPGVVGGTETYAAGLLQGLAAIVSDNEFVVFVNREAADWPLPPKSNFTRIVCPIIGPNRAQRYYFEQIRLPLRLRRERIDLVHSLGYVGPVICPCPSVLTIPDSNYVDVAQTIPTHRRIALGFVSRQAARTATEIITISEFSKERLCQTLKLPADKITVTHLAPHPEAISSSTENWPELRQRYGIREPYIVAFGGGAVHKNIVTLLQAFIMLSEQLPHDLVLIGHLPPNVDIATIARQQELRGRIITTGHVPNTHIRPLLSHADVFVLPSLYEGFGLPVLEAQQAGVAVACSTAGSLPEVAGDGAAFFDPRSADDLARTALTILGDTAIRSNLIRRGQENLQRFSWQMAAQETLSVYERALLGVTRRKSAISSELI